MLHTEGGRCCRSDGARFALDRSNEGPAIFGPLDLIRKAAGRGCARVNSAQLAPRHTTRNSHLGLKVTGKRGHVCADGHFGVRARVALLFGSLASANVFVVLENFTGLISQRPSHSGVKQWVTLSGIVEALRRKGDEFESLSASTRSVRTVPHQLKLSWLARLASCRYRLPLVLAAAADGRLCMCSDRGL